MAARRSGQTMVKPLSDILRTTERQVEVVCAQTGVAVVLPRRSIDFVRGHVVMPYWVWRTIWQPTVARAREGSNGNK